MIHLIEGRKVTTEDIGSPVTYHPPHTNMDSSHKDVERGHISSFNEHNLFVRFKAACGASCNTKYLKWG